MTRAVIACCFLAGFTAYMYRLVRSAYEWSRA